MKSTDRGVLLGLVILGIFASFWFLVLAPKRERASELQTEIDETSARVEQQQQLATFAEQAKDEYGEHYRRLVVLGKAVPEDDDTSTLLTQVNTISSEANVEFRDIELVSTGQAVPAAPATPPPATTETTGTAATSEATPAPAAAPAPAPVAAEAVAASLPIGATIGPAGLPVMPYDVVLRGDFFNLAEVLDGVDDLVHADEEGVTVSGRLLTVDGFNFEQDRRDEFPSLKATLALTSYIVPSTQGLLGGATAAAPATSVPAAVPTAAPTATPTSTIPTP